MLLPSCRLPWPQEPAPQGALERATAWWQAHPTAWLWLLLASLASLLLVLLLLPVVVVRLPADYFAVHRAAPAAPPGFGRWLLRLGKNLLGAVFVVVGLALLLLPGQGLLTILIGVLLLDFPGKRAVERRIVRRPAILAFLNRLRARHQRPPLQVD